MSETAERTNGNSNPRGGLPRLQFSRPCGLTEEIGTKNASVHHHLPIRNGGSRPSIWQEVL